MTRSAASDLLGAAWLAMRDTPDGDRIAWAAAAVRVLPADELRTYAAGHRRAARVDIEIARFDPQVADEFLVSARVNLFCAAVLRGVEASP